ncbi:MAG TPA: FmdC precursor [Bacteroidetes bacterium]|nr:FmdC precursor [Bacteroidota bacterium]
MKIKLFITVLTFILSVSFLFAQKAKMTYLNGISVVAPDSSYSFNIKGRIQSLYEAKQSMKDGSFNDDFSNKMMIRRARLKFGGFAFDPSLTYKIELGLSNRDRSISVADAGEFGNADNLILDMVIKWKFSKNTQVWFGQTKLPGNRERLVSSQGMQFVNRSQLNSKFNIDRDFGVHLINKTKLGDMIINEKFAISSGDGRNITSSSDKGFCYTGRIELLPFGRFSTKGVYYMADIQREEKPKMEISVAYSYNNNARRSQGQIESFVPDSAISDLRSLFADVFFKYNGVSFMAAYASRAVENLPEVNNIAVVNPYYDGDGFNIQLAYLTKKDIELAARYTQINPVGRDSFTDYSFALSKYFVENFLKVQTDLSYTQTDNSNSNDLMYRFQVEMAF